MSFPISSFTHPAPGSQLSEARPPSVLTQPPAAPAPHGEATAPRELRGPASAPPASETREAFQDFVAGTFYGQMLKALRSTQDKPKYMHGGRAEDMFRAQLDQQISEQLARDHGAALADPLFQSFARPRVATRSLPMSSASATAPVAVPVAVPVTAEGTSGTAPATDTASEESSAPTL